MTTQPAPIIVQPGTGQDLHAFGNVLSVEDKPTRHTIANQPGEFIFTGQLVLCQTSLRVAAQHKGADRRNAKHH